MRKRFLTLGTVIAVLALVGAPAAQAHHVDHASSSITCALVGGVPTIQTHVAYREYEAANTPAYFEIYLDRIRVDSGYTPTFTGSYDLARSTATTAGAHLVYFATTWPQGHDEISQSVSCPAPPPVVPTPTPTPPPPTITPTPPSAPPPVPLVKHCTKAHVHLKVYPRRRLHGLVDFVASGVRASDVASVRWYVRRPGHGWQRVGTSHRPWEYLAHHGLSWHVYLWVEQVWGFPQWGHRDVKVVVKTKGAGGTCVDVASAQMDYFNHDPEPRARNWG